eukprot:g65306.t1
MTDYWPWDLEQSLLLWSIPLVSAIVGWATNVVALQMTFYPLEFWGWGQFRKDQPYGLLGWQGIIPAKSAKMAAKTVELMTSQLIDVKEVFSRIEPESVSRLLLPRLVGTMEKAIEDVASKKAPAVWNMMPELVKRRVFESVSAAAPIHLEHLFYHLRENIEDVLDLREMVIQKFTEDKDLLNRMFQQVGDKEFTFIRRSGFYFGFLFGLPQMGLFMVYAKNWLLPLFGFFVGWATNWLALKCIFEPVEPRTCVFGPCSCTLHGLFMRRQKGVAAKYGELVARDVLNAENIIDALLTGPLKSEMLGLISTHVQEAIDDFIGCNRAFVRMTVGTEELNSTRQQLSDAIVDEAPEMFKEIEAYTQTALDLERTLREKMEGLSFSAFEGALHPVFQEDEITLIIVGAVLGMLVGFAQIPFQNLAPPIETQ